MPATNSPTPPPTTAAGPQPEAEQPRSRRESGALITTLAVIALLYFGREVLLPFALAVLLAFVLDPAVTWLRRWRLPRGVAVISVILATMLVLGATSALVGVQLVQLGKDLPTYQNTIQQKVRSLRQLTARQSVVGEASRVIEVVGGEIEAVRRDLGRSPPDSRREPTRVVVEEPPSGPLQAMQELVAPILSPLASAGVVLVCLIFLLLERNDLRDRLLCLAGGSLHRSTDALGEAAERVSRYLTMQLLVNLSYGVPMAFGLWLIGVPGALLWGVLAGLLRFVPYIGPAFAATFPLTLAFAVDPGWQMLAWTLGLVVTLELISNNIVEPWLYGASTGLSSISVIVSAVFWTAVWGPIGLILATPLTVCLTVLARHLPALAWLDVLLGSAPAFDPPTRLYQRLLANNVEEAVEIANEAITGPSPGAFYNDTAVPVLRLAALDQGRRSRVEHRHRVASGMGALLRYLREDHPALQAGDERATVLCAGARWEIDTLGAEMLGHALACEGVPTRVLPASAVSAEHIQSLPLDGVRVLCLSSFSTTPEAQLRFIVRRLKRRHPGLRVVAALWSATPALLSSQAVAELGVDAVARELGEAVQRVMGALPWQGTAIDKGEASGLQAASSSDVQRLRALHACGALDPALRAPLDRAAQKAADVFAMPLAMVNFVDRTHRISQGVAGPDGQLRGQERVSYADDTMCAQVVATGQTLVVEDTARDPRCAQLPSVQQEGLRFYAGAPLRTSDGQVIGALCVLDHVPRRLAPGEQRLLERLADDVMCQLASPGAPSGPARRNTGEAARATAATGVNEPGSLMPGAAPA